MLKDVPALPPDLPTARFSGGRAVWHITDAETYHHSQDDGGVNGSGLLLHYMIDGMRKYIHPSYFLYAPPMPTFVVSCLC